MDENIDFQAVIDQLQKENEGLRERLAQIALKESPLQETIDGIVLVVQKSDPLKVYMWALAGFLIIMAIARLLEVFIK